MINLKIKSEDDFKKNYGCEPIKITDNYVGNYGDLSTKEVDYIAFRGSRNLNKRSTHTTEYIFVLKKK